MIIKAVLLVVWILVARTEGARDGHFFHDRNTSSNPDKENMHWLFALERFIILSLICWIHVLVNSIFNTGIFALSLALMFSYFHNGEYYRTRNSLDKNVYPKGWFDSSTTSESIVELNVGARTFLAIVGFIGAMASFILK